MNVLYHIRCEGLWIISCVGSRFPSKHKPEQSSSHCPVNHNSHYAIDPLEACSLWRELPENLFGRVYALRNLQGKSYSINGSYR